MPIKVRSAESIHDFLELMEYDEDEEGDWYGAEHRAVFYKAMWKYCGSVPNYDFLWEVEWLEKTKGE